MRIASASLDAEGGGQQTRVAENGDGSSSAWDWDGTERIGVQLYADGETATYTLNADKTLTATLLAGYADGNRHGLVSQQ